MSTRKVLSLFALGQVLFIVGLAICILIKPSGLSTNDGISYYGTYISTFLPYAFCLLGPAVFNLILAAHINQTRFKNVRLLLVLFSTLALLITITPYSVDSFLDWLHTISGALLFIAQLILSFWLVLKLKHDAWVVALGALELTAGIGAAIFVIPAKGFLIQSQTVFQLSFGILIIYSFNRILPK